MLLTINNIQMEKWYDHEPFAIYRGISLSTDEKYWIKMLKAEFPTQQQIEWITNEYENGRHIQLKELVKPLRLDTYNSTLMLIMDHSDGHPLSHLTASGPMELKLFLFLAVAMTELLRKLHQHKYVHLNITPNAFIVQPAYHKVQLSDLNAACSLEHGFEPKPSFELLDCRLPYMAPEQFGRIDCRIDYRADIYSLGIVFYDMLTGMPPFSGSDTTEWIHQHMARQPTSPAETSRSIPKAVSDIVMKCLSKHPGHRYQSAFALKCDLEACLTLLLGNGPVDQITLEAGHAADIFKISDRLYGREHELQVIRDSYDHTLLENSVMVFVSGLSGVGKSYLIQEFQKSIAKEPGLFISGKFEQFKRDTPFQAIVQAGLQLIQYLLSLSDGLLQQWKRKILDAVSPNGHILIDMVPEMEKIIGSQPPLPKLPPAEMHNRFLATMQQFISVFATKEHPLVIFIDDLQWADPASLQLIQDLASQPPPTCCLFIGTFRSNDVTDAHPLRWLIDKLARLHHIHLVNMELDSLDAPDVRQLLTDTLRKVPAEPVNELAQTIIEKTKGNPFFAKQFLRSLYDHQLVQFNYDVSLWEWDIGKIRDLHITDNVVDFMINKIRRLPAPLQQLLMQAACIGHTFGTELLALAVCQDATEVELALQNAVAEGLLLAVSIDADHRTLKYSFLHDRVHQAVYSLVPKAQKKELHYHVGQLLYNSLSPEELEEHLFDVANQLNLGKELLQTTKEKERLAEFNVRACRKAKANTAYETALKFVTHSVQLLDANSWTHQYELTFSVYLELAELEYLCGHFEEAKRSFRLILNRARSTLEKADAYNLMMVLYTNLGLHEQAMEMGLEGLRLLGIPLDPNVRRPSILLEVAKTKWNMLAKQPEDLLDLPKMIDPEHKTIVKLMISLIAPTYFLNSDLYVFLMLKLFNFSLRFGNSEGSALAYSTYGVIISSVFGSMKEGAKFGKVSLLLCDSFDHLPIKCKVYFGYGAFTNNITQHIESNIIYLKKAYQFGVESGDFIYGGYSVTFSFFLRLYKGDHLGEVHNETELYQPFVERTQDKDNNYILLSIQRYMIFLKGDPDPSGMMNPDDRKPFMGEADVLQLESLTNKAVIHTYYALQLQAYYILNRLDEAKQLMETIEASIQSVFGLIHIQMYYFMSSLVICAVYPEASPYERKRYRSKLSKHLKQLKKWSAHSPGTFLPQQLLIEAEMNRIFRNGSLAAEQYDQAVMQAHKQRFVHLEAIANECAANFYTESGKMKIARSYLMEAKQLYAKWGALRKVAQLENKHPYLSDRTPSAQSAIDASTVVKASQALSKEAGFHKLLESFMHIVMENAGSEKGLLLLMRENRLYIEVEKLPDRPFKAQHAVPVDDYDFAAVSAIQYAVRKEEPLLLNDAANSDMFPKDRYIQAHLPKSVLVLPIVKLGKVTGVLYLENNLATHVFQKQRLDTLKLLTAEIIGTIENAKLYTNLEYKDYKLQLMEEREKNIQLQLDEKERWVQSSEATMLNIRKAQHELINNVQTVHALLMMNKYDMAKEYISVWCKEIVQQAVVNSVKFPVLGVVLNNISLPCISNKIELQVTGKLDCTFDELTLPISYFSSIVHNLLKNAIEAIPDDDPFRTLRLGIEEHDDHYQLVIFNTGSFIPQERRGKIFERGFSTKPDTTNSGLGLHIVHNYLQHYEGSIHCDSVEGEGTTFTVCLKKQPPGLSLAASRNP